MVFAVTMTAIMGMVGLAAEAGMWYSLRRDAQNAADAAALAGALVTANGGGDPTASAIEVASSNGYDVAGGRAVTVSRLAIGANMLTAPVQVTVSSTPTPLLSGLVSYSAPTVGASAAAAMRNVGSACLMALSGGLTVNGTSNSTTCTFASNANTSTAINVTGSVNLQSLNSAGGCCGSGSVTIRGRPIGAYQVPSINNFAVADAVVLPTFTSATCDSTMPPAISVASVPTITLVPYETSNRAYCPTGGTWTIPSGTTVVVPSGTFFFHNTSIVVNGTLKCGGVPLCTTAGAGGVTGNTIVLTGTTGAIGTLTIASTATITLSAPATPNTGFPGLRGLLFYGRGISPVSVNLITRSPNAPPYGGWYFPNAAMTFLGNQSSTVTIPPISGSTCIPIVANGITLGTSQFSIASCTAYGTSPPTMQAARLVQ